VVDERGKSPIEEEVNVVLEDKKQGKHEEVIRPRVVEPNVLRQPSLRPSLGNSWRCSESYKSTSHF